MLPKGLPSHFKTFLWSMNSLDNRTQTMSTAEMLMKTVLKTKGNHEKKKIRIKILVNIPYVPKQYLYIRQSKNNMGQCPD